VLIDGTELTEVPEFCGVVFMKRCCVSTLSAMCSACVQLYLSMNLIMVN